MVEFCHESTWPLIFFFNLIFGSFFSLLFQSPLMCLFMLLTSSWFNFGGMTESRNLHFFQVFQLNGVQVLKVFLYYTLNFFGVCCNVSLLISDSTKLDSLFLFFVWAKDLSILFIFWKRQNTKLN